jgi:CheY-like chemotaxis protein
MTSATIFYVDDDADDRTFLKEAFAEKSFPSVLYFEDAPSVLSFLMNIKDDALLPKLIITDINMPKMTGIELLSLLKRDVRFKNIKVIVFSTADENRSQKECITLGAAEFLQKPNTFSELRQIANHFMYQ